MRRIAEEDLLRLKAAVPLAALCAKYGIALKAHGSADLIGRCPFHEDRTPSFVVTPAKNLWHCLGACGVGGSNIDLVMKSEGVSFIHAVEKLREALGEAPAPALYRTRQGTEHAVLVEPGVELSDAALWETVLRFYHQSFLSQSAAMRYLQERGCFHPEAVTKFKPGFANRTLGYRLPMTTRHGRDLKAQLTRLGIMRESGHEHLSGCVVVPVFNDREEVAELYGRRITKAKPVQEGSPHLYLPGPHAGVWNAHEIKTAREWLLCESAIDALSLWVNGFANVTWSYGVNGFTPDHWQLLRSCRPERIVIFYDNDEAGNRAANELVQKLEPEGVAVWRVELKPRSDVNDLVRSSKEPRAALASLLAEAKRMLPPSSVPFLAAPQSAPPAVEAAKEKIQSPVPNENQSTPLLRVSEDGRQAELVCGERAWRVRGLETNTSFDHLKVNVRLAYRNRFHLDTFDLYAARSRATFLAQAEEVTGADKPALESDLAQLIAQLEAHQEKKIMAAMKPLEAGPVLSPEEETAALQLLKEPRLFERILADFASVGTVGEDANKLLGYLIAVSRKLDDPLSGLIVSRSAAGKSALLGAILDFVPEEEKQVVTSMTTQALYYLPNEGLKHKVLAVVEDEGSETASYPLKILQSEKKLILAVTVKDPDGGMPKTELKTVEGPVAQFMTSTQAEFDEELANRYLVLSVDEEREQTRRIHAAQREAETLRGLLRTLEREEVLRTHHNAQRLLRPLRVVNPFADQLSFPDDRLRLRRDHKKYLGLIRVIAFLRQFQKPIRSCEHRGQTLQYIEVDEDDLRLAHELAAQVLGRSLDELAPPSRSFLLALDSLLETLGKEQSLQREKVRFTRREARERLKWSEPQVRRHLDKLQELEYVLCHRVPGTAARFTYELLYDGEGKDGSRFLLGLNGKSSPANGESSC